MAVNHAAYLQRSYTVSGHALRSSTPSSKCLQQWSLEHGKIVLTFIRNYGAVFRYGQGHLALALAETLCSPCSEPWRAIGRGGCVSLTVLRGVRLLLSFACP